MQNLCPPPSPSAPQVPPDLGSSYSDVLALHDVAVYGSLTALASLEREELRQRVIGSIGFREVLELAPEVGKWGGAVGVCAQGWLLGSACVWVSRTEGRVSRRS